MANLDDLLEKTSRTFALSIPPLPEPTRRQVSIAYLLFRIADTFEDAELWPPDERRKALADFAGLLELSSEAGRGVTGGGYLPPARWSVDTSPQGVESEGSADSPKVAPGRTPRPASEPQALAAAWTTHPPCDHAGYLELLRETPSVLHDFASLDAPARAIVAAHVRRSCEGMASFVSRMTPAGDLVLNDLSDLRSYCYAVAGIVGEMLTGLFLLNARLAPVQALLERNAALFGEGLQLVNILKDSSSDARSGRRYVPDSVDRADVFALARADLAAAAEYVLALQKNGAPRGFVAFTALPVELACASLDRIEKSGPGSKISRPEVFWITRRLERALDRNEPAIFSIS